MMKEITVRIKKTILKNELIEHGSRVLVALSGGADSVLLTHALHELSQTMGFEVSACHLEHGFRGEDSLRDMEFSRCLCAELGIAFYSKQVDVPSVAKSLKMSEEAAGRKIRYEFFSSLLEEHGLNLIATAHHRDDKVETILMNIIRGSGSRGLIGIRYKNGNVIRPLLDLTKNEILSACADNGISYCTDLTNSEDLYTRNRVRHELVPMLKTYNPSFDGSLIRASGIFEAENDFLDSLARRELEASRLGGGLSAQYLNALNEAVQRRVIYLYISEIKNTDCDISFEDVESVKMLSSGTTGKRADIGGGLCAYSSYGVIRVCVAECDTEFEYRLLPETPCFVPEIGKCFTLKNADSEAGFSIDKNDEILIRSRRDGDYFYPVGMKGKKKVKDFFIDNKISRTQRSKIPILVVNGEIAAIIGMRADRRFSGKNGTYALLVEKM